MNKKIEVFNNGYYCFTTTKFNTLKAAKEYFKINMVNGLITYYDYKVSGYVTAEIGKLQFAFKVA